MYSIRDKQSGTAGDVEAALNEKARASAKQLLKPTPKKKSGAIRRVVAAIKNKIVSPEK